MEVKSNYSKNRSLLIVSLICEMLILYFYRWNLTSWRMSSDASVNNLLRSFVNDFGALLGHHVLTLPFWIILLVKFARKKKVANWVYWWLAGTVGLTLYLTYTYQ